MSLIILGVLSAADLAGPSITDGQHPPMFIALIGSAFGVISIVLSISAWRGRPAAAITLVVVRLLSALSAVPAFAVPGVPTGPMIIAGVFIALTLAGVVAVLSGFRRRPAVVSAR